MNSICEKMKDQIADLVTGILPEAQVHDLEQHLNECAACRDYARALKDEDMLLTEFFAKIDTDMTSRQERVLQTVNRSCLSKQTDTLSIRRIIMKNPITKLAAAAVIIIAVLIGINQFGGSIDGASVAWADVAERFESVPFFNVTIYLGLGPYAEDQKMEIHKIEIWTSENSQTRTHSGNEVIFADFADGNNVVVAFDSSTMQPLNADRMAKVANSFHGFLRAEGEFSLDALLNGFPADDKGITLFETADTAASKETVLFEVKHKTTPTTQCSIWALRKSKLPIRASLRAPQHKIYADLLFNYSEKKDTKFFDPEAFTSQQTDGEDRQRQRLQDENGTSD